MKEKSTCCCSGLPRFWWWLTALLGFLLLFAATITTRQSVIEEDIRARTTASLKAANHDGIQVLLQGRGRDVLLSGVAVSNEAKANAIELVQAVNGVRVVEDRMTIATSPVSAEVVVETLNGVATLQGELASQQAIDQLVDASVAAFGQGNIRNELKLNDGLADAAWLGRIIDVMPEVSGMGKALFKVNDEGASLSGEIANADLEDSIKAELSKGFGSVVTTDFTVNTPEVGVSEAAIAVESEAAAKVDMPVTAEAEAEVATKVKAEAAVDANTEAEHLVCQKLLDDTMSGKSILFATNEATIRETSHVLLDEIGTVLDRCEAIVAVKGLIIDGYTDDRGEADYNLGLSQRRADAVKDYLVASGILDSLISAEGHGESDPVASNDTAEGRARNRRITFTIEQN